MKQYGKSISSSDWVHIYKVHIHSITILPPRMFLTEKYSSKIIYIKTLDYSLLFYYKLGHLTQIYISIISMQTLIRVNAHLPVFSSSVLGVLGLLMISTKWFSTSGIYFEVSDPEMSTKTLQNIHGPLEISLFQNYFVS